MNNSANNQTILIPNGILSNGIITNFSVAGMRRIDLVFSLSYDTDIKAAREIVLEVIKNHSKVLKDPEPMVIVKDITDSDGNNKHITFGSEAGKDEYYVLYAYFLQKTHGIVI